MNIIKKSIAPFLFVLLIASCTKETLRGEGPVTTETRELTSFSEVSISGIHEAEMIYSTVSKVEISGYANLSAILESDVSGNRLSLKYPNNTRVRNDNLKFKIYTPNLRILRQSGNTKIKVGAGFNPESIRVLMSGNTRFDMEENTTNSFRVEASGNSKIYARKLVAKSAEVSASGNTEVELTATDYLNVHATGSTRVWYWGPVANTDISTTGSARVSRQ